MILTNLYGRDMITEKEFDTNKWDIRKIEEGFFKGEVNAPEAFFSDIENKKVSQRISVFLNSLLMDMPMVPVWEKIRILTVMTPVGATETLLYTYAANPGMKQEDIENTLDTRLKTGVTNLTYLISRYTDEWGNFIERIKKLGIAAPEEITRMQNLKLGDELGQVNEKLEWEIRLWSSNRFQPFLRTLGGLMNYVEVLRLYARINHPEWDKNTIDLEVNRKYQLLWGHQGYGDFVVKKEPKAKETEILVKYYYEKYGYLIDIAYIQARNGMQFNVLARLNPVTGNIEDVYTMKLTEDFPMLGEGKPGNQTHTRRFARGEVILTIDMNQDFYIEQTLKIPHLMTLYDDPLVAIVGYPEDIYTDTYGLIAKFHAIADRSFVTIVQRVLTLLGVRFHYGHPDLWRASFTDAFGGVSRSYPVNEDIFGGYEMTLKGKKIVFVEWIEAGKAREVSWGTTFGIWVKFGMGAAQQLYNRFLYYLYTSDNFGFTERIAHFFGGIGYYFRKSWSVTGQYGYLVFLLLMGISGFSSFPEEIVFALFGIFIFAQAITLTGLLQYILERPFLKAIAGFAVLWVVMSPFFMAHIFTYATGVIFAMLGVATYVPTGRGFMLEHKKLSDLLKAYSKTHIFKGLIGTALAVWGIIIWANPTLILSFPFIAMMVFGLTVPFITNKGSLPMFGTSLKQYFKFLREDFKDGKNFVKNTWSDWDGTEKHNKDRGTLLDAIIYTVSFGIWVALSMIMIIPGLLMNVLWNSIYFIKNKQTNNPDVFGIIIEKLLNKESVLNNLRLARQQNDYNIVITDELWDSILEKHRIRLEKMYAVDKMKEDNDRVEQINKAKHGLFNKMSYEFEKSQREFLFLNDKTNPALKPVIQKILLKESVLISLIQAKAQDNYLLAVTQQLWDYLDATLKVGLLDIVKGNLQKAQQQLFKMMDEVNTDNQTKVRDSELDSEVQKILIKDSVLNNLRLARENNNHDLVITNDLWDSIPEQLKYALLYLDKNDENKAKKVLFNAKVKFITKNTNKEAFAIIDEKILKNVDSLSESLNNYFRVSDKDEKLKIEKSILDSLNSYFNFSS